jgi:hypothetical protein
MNTVDKYVINKAGEVYELVYYSREHAIVKHLEDSSDRKGEMYEREVFKKNFTKYIPEENYLDHLDNEAKAAFFRIKDILNVPQLNIYRQQTNSKCAGNNLELLLGMQPNNKACTDVGNLEIKTQSFGLYKDDNDTSLFTLSPKLVGEKIKNLPNNKTTDSANTYLRDMFGHPDSDYTDKNVLSVTLKVGEWNKCYNYEFSLEIDEDLNLMYYNVRDYETKENVSYREVGESLNTIYNTCKKKLKNLLDIYYKFNDDNTITYSGGMLRLNIDKPRFIEYIKSGDIKVRLSNSIKKNFKDTSKNGEHHPHGTAYLISPSIKNSLYEHNINLKIDVKDYEEEE